MLHTKREDMKATALEAIEAAKNDPEFVLLPDDLVLQKDPGFDDEGMFVVVSKTIDSQHFDKFTVVGKVGDFQ